MTGGPDLGHHNSRRVYYDQCREVCSTASLFLPTSVVHLVCQAVRSIPTLSDGAVFDTQVGVLKAKLEGRNEVIGALELQVASKDAEIVTRVGQLDMLEGRLGIAKKGLLLMSGTIRENGPQLCAAEMALSVLRLLYVLLHPNFNSSAPLNHHLVRVFVN